MSLWAERSREVETETFIRIAIFLGGAMFGGTVGLLTICLFMGASRRKP